MVKLKGHFLQFGDILEYCYGPHYLTINNNGSAVGKKPPAIVFYLTPQLGTPAFYHLPQAAAGKDLFHRFAGNLLAVHTQQAAGGQVEDPDYTVLVDSDDAVIGAVQDIV